MTYGGGGGGGGHGGLSGCLHHSGASDYSESSATFCLVLRIAELLLDLIFIAAGLLAHFGVFGDDCTLVAPFDGKYVLLAPNHYFWLIWIVILLCSLISGVWGIVSRPTAGGPGATHCEDGTVVMPSREHLDMVYYYCRVFIWGALYRLLMVAALISWIFFTPLVAFIFLALAWLLLSLLLFILYWAAASVTAPSCHGRSFGWCVWVVLFSPLSALWAWTTYLTFFALSVEGACEAWAGFGPGETTGPTLLLCLIALLVLVAATVNYAPCAVAVLLWVLLWVVFTHWHVCDFINLGMLWLGLAIAVLIFAAYKRFCRVCGQGTWALPTMTSEKQQQQQQPLLLQQQGRGGSVVGSGGVRTRSGGGTGLGRSGGGQRGGFADGRNPGL